VKLARLRKDNGFCDLARILANDAEEDVYVRLEAVSYLNSTCGESARSLFARYLSSNDEQTQLEAVIALAESGTDEAIVFLRNSSQLIRDRISAKRCRMGTGPNWFSSRRLAPCCRVLDVDLTLREEALDGLVCDWRHCIANFVDRLAAF